MSKLPVIDAFSNEIPKVFADHSIVDVTVNGKRFILFNGGDLLHPEKGISPNTIWARVENVGEMNALIKLDNFLLSEIIKYLGGDVNFEKDQGARLELLPKYVEGTGIVEGIQKDWSKEIMPKEHDPYLKKAIEIATNGYKEHVLNTSLHTKMKRLAEARLAEADAEADAKAKPYAMLHYLIKITEAADPAAAEAAKTELFNQLQDWYTELAANRKYYIHQSHGMIWNQQQPLGGFSLEGVAPEYLNEDKYRKLVKCLPGDKTERYGCEATGLEEEVGNIINSVVIQLPDRDNILITGVHLPSSGDNRDKLKDIVGEGEEEEEEEEEEEDTLITNLSDPRFNDRDPVRIVLGDTNITKLKLKGEEPNLRALVKEMSNKTRKKVTIVMRNVEVSKMRTGGPLSNTQIYKSYLPVSEKDGMMVIVIGDADIVADDTHTIYGPPLPEGAASPAAAQGESEAAALRAAGLGEGAGGGAAPAAAAAPGGGGRVRKARKSRKAKKHSKRARRGGSRKKKSKKQKKSRKN